MFIFVPLSYFYGVFIDELCYVCIFARFYLLSRCFKCKTIVFININLWKVLKTDSFSFVSSNKLYFLTLFCYSPERFGQSCITNVLKIKIVEFKVILVFKWYSHLHIKWSRLCQLIWFTILNKLGIHYYYYWFIRC